MFVCCRKDVCVCGLFRKECIVNVFQCIVVVVGFVVFVLFVFIVFVVNIVIVGGVEMYFIRIIVENVVNFKDYIILVVVVKVVGLVDIFNGVGFFIVFVFINVVFEKLFVGIVDILVKFENKVQLIWILIYYVVLGNYSFVQFLVDVCKYSGKVILKIVQGEFFIVVFCDGKFWVIDVKGGKVGISVVDVSQFNGVIYVVDIVLMFKQVVLCNGYLV